MSFIFFQVRVSFTSPVRNTFTLHQFEFADFRFNSLREPYIFGLSLHCLSLVTWTFASGCIHPFHRISSLLFLLSIKGNLLYLILCFIIYCYFIYGHRIYQVYGFYVSRMYHYYKHSCSHSIYYIGSVSYLSLLSLVWQWSLFFNLEVFIPQIRYVSIRTGWASCLCFLSLIVYPGTLTIFVFIVT